jgi:pimeloyl-ACP methyl ester carboxylesterase
MGMRAWTAYAAAQARLGVGLVSALDPPLLGAVTHALSGRPRVDDTTVGGVPATVFRPGRGRGPWPAVVVIPGITRRGRTHPGFHGVGVALAAMGRLAVVAEPAGVSVGELSPTIVDASRTAALATASRPDARGTIALAGVSGGATLALLLAAEPELSEQVSVVAALAPCCDIEQAVRVATTGTYRDGAALSRFEAGSFARLVVARSTIAALPPCADRDALRSHLLGLVDDDPEPLAALRAWPRGPLGASTRAVLDLLGNTDPARFDELSAALPEELRSGLAALSPLHVADRIEAPVEVVVGRTDKYLPLFDAEAFAAACPTARLTVIESLAHAVPQLGMRELQSLAQLDAVLVRVLVAAERARDPR